MSYKKKDYLLAEYSNLSGNDFQVLKYGWMRKIKKELKLKHNEFTVWRIEDNFFNPESYETLF